MTARSQKLVPDPIDAHVGSRVRMRRQALRMSQTVLAGALGITFQQIQKYENGTNRISASALVKVADALDVDVPFFFQGAPRKNGKSSEADLLPAQPRDLAASREGARMLHDFYRIKDPAVRACVANLVRYLADKGD
jgi:transcriptional regulator with XRE-family HTH domain